MTLSWLDRIGHGNVFICESALRRIFPGWTTCSDHHSHRVWHECVLDHMYEPDDCVTLLADRNTHVLLSKLDATEWFTRP